MMTSKSIILLLFSILLVSVPRATSASIEDNFINCLEKTLTTPKISESIYTQVNSSFASVLENYKRNLRFDKPTTPKPVVIVTAKNESHVQATVVCAKQLGLELRIRSGGHDYEGVSYVSNVTFVLLDLFNLRSINIDVNTETAWVQAGAIMGELYTAIAQKSKGIAFAGGVCPGLGAGGHITGGGYGNLMRKFGLATDNVLDVQIVDVKGRILNRKSMGEDFFWAIRGGGASSFGVILSWQIKLVQIPEIVTVFRVNRTLEQGATDVLLQWQQIADKLPKEIFIRAVVSTANGSLPGNKTVKAQFIAMFLGRANEVLTLVNQRFPKLGLQKKDCIEMSWLESIVFWFELPAGTPTSALLLRGTKPAIFLKRKSDYVKQVIPKDGLETIWKAMIELGDGIKMEWNPYGGKMSEIPETDSPFPHRAGNIFKVQYNVNWFQEGDTNHFLDATRKLYQVMTPYVSQNPRESFLNYRDLEIGTRSINGTYDEAKVYGLKYFKGNFDRLVRVKTLVDPDNFFRNEQSIPTLPS